jgi:hypothetical protein
VPYDDRNDSSFDNDPYLGYYFLFGKAERLPTEVKDLGSARRQ